MAKKSVTKHTWNQMTMLETAGQGQKTATSISGKPLIFKTPVVLPVDLEAAAKRVVKAWSEKDNGKEASDELANAIGAIRGMLLKLAYYVDDIADGDSDIIHAAGLESTSDSHSKHNAPETPRASVLGTFAGGTVTSTVITVTDTDKYTHIAVIDGPFNVTILHGEIFVPTGTEVRIIPHANLTATFRGLPAHKSIAVGVIAHNNGGASGISTISTTSALP